MNHSFFFKFIACGWQPPNLFQKRFYKFKINDLRIIGLFKGYEEIEIFWLFVKSKSARKTKKHEVVDTGWNPVAQTLIWFKILD